MARQAPSAAFWFGTDLLGRDVFSRVLVGSQISLQLGFISVTLGAIPGVLLGLVAGYRGGWWDTLISRVMDALLAFPSILLALVVIAALGPSIQNVMIAVGRRDRAAICAAGARQRPVDQATALCRGGARRRQSALAHHAAACPRECLCPGRRAFDAAGRQRHPHRLRACPSSGSARSRPSPNGG